MGKFLIRKVLQFALMLILISLLIFFGMRATGLNPVYFMFNMDNFDPELVPVLEHQLGLDRPLIIQYFSWLGGLLKGDFGISYVGKWEIADRLFGMKTFQYSFELALWALLISTVVGILLGILCAYKQNTIIDYIGRVISVFGNSMPSYFLGLILLEIFAISLGWFPLGGRVGLNETDFLSRMKHMALPLACQTIPMIGNLLRFTRNTMLDVANREFVKTARSKGISEWKVYFKHVFRNSLGPVMVLVIFRLSMLVGGSVAIEQIFAWPGMGQIMVSAITSGDFPVVMIIAMMTAVVMLICSFLCDVFTALIDPRVRLEV